MKLQFKTLSRASFTIDAEPSEKVTIKKWYYIMINFNKNFVIIVLFQQNNNYIKMYINIF